MRTSLSLTERRLLPRAERELFEYEIVRFHLDDLNALAERRAGAPDGPAFVDHERGRMASIIQAARWDRAGFMRAIKRYLAEGRGAGADAFGPALLLMALGAAPETLVPTASLRILATARRALEGASAVFQTSRPRGSSLPPARVRRF